MAPAPMSSSTATICATTIEVGTMATSRTPVVFWAVMAVRALVPNTPNAANVFRSAWMPAPPPESLPAIVSAVGIDRAPPAPSSLIEFVSANASEKRRHSAVSMLPARRC